MLVVFLIFLLAFVVSWKMTVPNVLFIDKCNRRPKEGNWTESCFRKVNKRGGLWGILETAKPKKKSSKTAKPQKNSAKTENRIQNRQKPIQWWQVGHTEQTKLTLIPPKYLWMSWTLSEAFVSFCVCLNHRLCFCRSLEPRLCGSISEKPLVMEPS